MIAKVWRWVNDNSVVSTLAAAGIVWVVGQVVGLFPQSFWQRRAAIPYWGVGFVLIAVLVLAAYVYQLRRRMYDEIGSKSFEGKHAGKIQERKEPHLEKLAEQVLVYHRGLDVNYGLTTTALAEALVIDAEYIRFHVEELCRIGYLDKKFQARNGQIATALTHEGRSYLLIHNIDLPQDQDHGRDYAEKDPRLDRIV